MRKAKLIAASERAPGAEPRGARRKRETRARLLDAALRLMSERGMEGVAINEITEAADVGFGSFYNHFASKEAIYETLLDEAFERFADALDALVAGVDDPAEVIAISVRHTVARALATPVWGRFMIREGLSAQTLARGLGRRLLRDIRDGIDAGRFKTDDPVMTFIATAGVAMAAISAALPGNHGAAASLIEKLGFDAGGVPERTAATVLRALGLSVSAARAIANRPLPAFDARASGGAKSS